jgi:putative peptidoglycan lipid II flippase
MSLKRETVKYSLVTGMGIVVGFLFHILLGRTFGASWQLDCLFISLTLYSWLGMFNLFMTSLYIPIFNDVKKHSFEESMVFGDVVLKWVFFISLVVVLTSLLFSHSIIKALAPGFSEEGILLTKEISQIIVFGVVFFSVSNVTVSTLNALYSFSVPALVGVIDPFLNIMAIYLLVPYMGVKAIAVSYLASNVIKTGVLLSFLYGEGWRPTKAFFHPQLKELVTKSAKMGLAGFIWSFRDIITRNIASQFGEGAVTIYFYAEKIITFLVKVVIDPPVRVYYSKVSEWIVRNEWCKVYDLLEKAVRINVSIAIIASASTVLFVPSLLYVLFHGSKFSMADIVLLSKMLKIMVVYFMILAFEMYLVRIIYSTKRMGVVAINATMGVVLLSLSIFFLKKYMGVFCLPAGITLSQSIVCGFYYFAVRKQILMPTRVLLKRFLVYAIIAVLFWVAGEYASGFFDKFWLKLVVVLPIWSLLYLFVARIVMKKEYEFLVSR